MIASQSWNLEERVEVITDLTLSQSGQAVRIFYIKCLREYVQLNNDSHIARSSSTFSGPLQYGLCCTGQWRLSESGLEFLAFHARLKTT